MPTNSSRHRTGARQLSRGNSARPNFGGYPFAESEYRPAGIARIFWRADFDPHVLHIVAEPAERGASETVDLADIGGDVFVQPRAGQGEHVLIRFGGLHLRFDILSGTVLDGPVRPRIVLPDLSGIAPQLLTLRRLTMLVQGRQLPRSLRKAEKRGLRWAKMIQALDGVVAGGSQREIASALFGEKLVRAEWRGVSDHLRLKVQRLLREARKLAGGGYRAILSGDDGEVEANSR